MLWGLLTAGASRYMRQNVIAGRLPWGQRAEFADEDLIAALVDVRGIWRGSAQMFMMFDLGVTVRQP